MVLLSVDCTLGHLRIHQNPDAQATPQTSCMHQNLVVVIQATYMFKTFWVIPMCGQG